MFEPGSDANDAFVYGVMELLKLFDPRPLVDALCKNNVDEKKCEENLVRDLATCSALGKRDGKSAYAICARQAYARYARCLQGSDITPPLPPWGTK